MPRWALVAMVFLKLRCHSLACYSFTGSGDEFDSCFVVMFDHGIFSDSFFDLILQLDIAAIVNNRIVIHFSEHTKRIFFFFVYSKFLFDCLNLFVLDGL